MIRLLILPVVLMLVGCQSQPEAPKDVLAKVGSYTITKAEFEQEYADSSYGAKNTPESRRDFLNNMINQKLILLDAQQRGLDKDKDFLKMVENFWQQSLLTAAMQQKAKEGGDLEKWVEYLKKNSQVEINEEMLK